DAARLAADLRVHEPRIPVTADGGYDGERDRDEHEHEHDTVPRQRRARYSEREREDRHECQPFQARPESEMRKKEKARDERTRRRAGSVDEVCKAEVAADASDRAGQRLRDGREGDAEEGRRRQDDERGGEDARELKGHEAHTERAERGELEIDHGIHERDGQGEIGYEEKEAHDEHADRVLPAAIEDREEHPADDDAGEVEE